MTYNEEKWFGEFDTHRNTDDKRSSEKQRVTYLTDLYKGIEEPEAQKTESCGES